MGSRLARADRGLFRRALLLVSLLGSILGSTAVVVLVFPGPGTVTISLRLRTASFIQLIAWDRVGESHPAQYVLQNSACQRENGCPDADTAQDSTYVIELGRLVEWSSIEFRSAFGLLNSERYVILEVASLSISGSGSPVADDISIRVHGDPELDCAPGQHGPDPDPSCSLVFEDSQARDCGDSCWRLDTGNGSYTIAPGIPFGDDDGDKRCGAEHSTVRGVFAAGPCPEQVAISGRSNHAWVSVSIDSLDGIRAVDGAHLALDISLSLRSGR